MASGCVQVHLETGHLYSHESQFRNVDIYTGDAAYYTVDSLSSFWPGLQVLGGDVENAIKAHLTCMISVFSAI